MIHMILAKPPLHLQDKWNRNTLLLKRGDSSEPTLIDLASIAEDEMTLANDPLNSRECVSQYLQKGPTRKGKKGENGYQDRKFIRRYTKGK